MAQYRYFLQFSPVEGFSLTPLEAMACGCTALGFHGFGGLEYMRPGYNCATVAYPNMEKLCDNVADMLMHPKKAEKFAKRGMPLIHKYTAEQYEKQWIKYLHKFLNRK
jgi:glycosyltransferase involved in cell wall biosynthesis